MDEISCFGFDMDYTLAEYLSPAMDQLGHSLAKQHLPPQTRQVVFHHRQVVDQTHNNVCAEPMRNKQQGHLILRIGCPLMWATP